MKVIIPSHNRSDSIGTHTLRWFPEAVVCVEAEEAADYEQVGCKLLLHPKLSGLPAILNWILDCSELAEARLAIIDGDLKYVESIIGEKPRKIEEIGDVMAIVENCCTMAEGFGARLWGFSCNRRPDSNYAYKPFSLAARISSFRGISDCALRFDEMFLRHDDVDLCLRELLIQRVVFRDDRFNFVFEPVYQTKGGSENAYQVARQVDEEFTLKRKWGKYVALVKSLHHTHETRICVER